MNRTLIVTRRLAWVLAVLAGALFIMAAWAQENLNPNAAAALTGFGLLSLWQAWRMRALAAKLRAVSDVPRELP